MVSVLKKLTKVHGRPGTASYSVKLYQNSKSRVLSTNLMLLEISKLVETRGRGWGNGGFPILNARGAIGKTRVSAVL